MNTQQNTKVQISIINLLIVSCIAIFVGMVFSGGLIFSEGSISFSNQVLMAFGARSNYEIVNGEYYRLIMSALVHSGIMHLIANMISMKLVGDIIEKVFGKTNLLIIIISGAVFGSVASFAFSFDTISVGASGIVFALMGAHVALYLTNKTLYKRYIGLDLLIFLGINIVIGLFDPTIDEFAHMGGLLGGFIVSIFMIKGAKKRGISMVLIGALMLSMSVGMYRFGVYRYTHSGNYACDYVIDLIERNEYQEAAKELIRARDSYPDNKRIEKLVSLFFMGEE